MTEAQPTSLPERTSLLRACDVALVLALLLVAFLFGCFQLWNVDIWWHLRTGQLIAERMQQSPWPWQWVPQTDWYSYTNAGRPWIDLHWGFQLVVAALHRAGGVPLLVLFKAALGVGAVGLCLAARHKHWSLPLVVACWVPALVVLSGRLYVRPEIFTLVYEAAFLAILFHGEHRPRLLWLLPVIQLLWVNSQGLFIFGPLLVGCYLVDRIVRWFARQGTMTPKDWKRLAAVVMLIGAACFVNPYTWRGVVFPVELYERVGSDRDFWARHVGELRGVGDFVREVISEGKFQGLLNPYLLAHLATFALGVCSFLYLAVAGWKRGGARLDVFRLLGFAGFSYLGWQARRNNNHFALVAGFATAANFAQGWSLLCGESGRRSHQPGWRGRTAVAIVLVALGWLVVSDRFYAWAGAGRHFGVGERKDWYPHQAMRFAGRAGMPRVALIAPWGHAASYIFHNAPARRVFMDGRLEVNDRPTMQRYVDIEKDLLSGGRDWERLLRDSLSGADDTDVALVIGRYNAFAPKNPFLIQRAGNLIPMDPGGALMLRLLDNPRWRCVYCDRTGAVFIDTQQADRLGLKEADLQVLLAEGR